MPKLENVPPPLRTVAIRNYRSIASCSVDLGRLTVLVGRNGAGKSNFVDALRFVADADRRHFLDAVRARGGWQSVVRRGADETVGFDIDLSVRDAGHKYSKCTQKVRRVENGGFCEPFPEAPPPVMEFYGFDPATMRKAQVPESGDSSLSRETWLEPDGRNLASMLARLKELRPERVERIVQYLSAIVPGIESVSRVPAGPWETLEFTQRVSESEEPTRFYATSMSDGTLRALAALVAVNQVSESGESIPFVAIEEPETALHPAAAGVLLEAFRAASAHTQILLTTHSPELIDELDLDTVCLLAVQFEGGETKIGPIDAASREAVRRHLATPGELLRMDQLHVAAQAHAAGVSS